MAGVTPEANTSTSLPSRFVNLDPVRARHGSLVDRLGARLLVGDPLGDAAVDAMAHGTAVERETWVSSAFHGRPAAGTPDAVISLIARATTVPPWVDPNTLDRGGLVHLRTGIVGGFVLAFQSLVMGYCSPAGNKPLAFSGRLAEDTQRRLVETSQYVEQTCAPGGMSRFGAGMLANLRVRLMHARVRRMLQRSPRWSNTQWGVPINQFDMAGTTLLFSLQLLRGARRLGLRFTRDESEAVLHLWRYAGHVLGVDDDLLCCNEQQADAVWDVIASTQMLPDDDARALTRALIENPRSNKTPEGIRLAERTVNIGNALCRYLLGDEAADHLCLPRTTAAPFIPYFVAFNRVVDRLRANIPWLERVAVRRGRAYWETVVAQGTVGRPVTFAMPEHLSQSTQSANRGTR